MIDTDCPECETSDTEKQATIDNVDIIDVVYTCTECVTQFTIEYKAVNKVTDYAEDHV